MKTIGLTGFILAILVSLIATYLLFVIVPEAQQLAISDPGSISYDTYYQVNSFLHDAAQLVLVLAAMSAVATFFVALRTRKRRLFYGVLLSVYSIIVGLLYGTSVFH